MTTRLEVGDLAPDFTLPTADGSPFTLSAHRGSRVVVYFYPAATTPACSMEAADFDAALEDFAAAGYTIVGVSPDTVEALAAAVEAEGTRYTLAADPGLEVLKAWGAWGEKNLYGRTVTAVLRSTFVVDPEGRLSFAAYNVKATGHVARLRRDLGV
ncbi:MAG: peroxiredoxin [Actinomycetales bacterium]|nr:peroxiredoxin [Actinomycetales bacterium]